MQPLSNEEAEVATANLLDTNRCNFDLALTGACLRPILFNIRSCTATENYYHGFVGEIVCGKWAIRMKKRYLWGTYFFWLCNMRTMYTGPIHILQQWCQELLAYIFLVYIVAI